MPLSAAPTFTPGSTGNIYATSTLAASASTTQGPIYIGVVNQGGSAGSTTTGAALSGRVQIIMTDSGTVAATYGLQVQVFSTSDGGTTYDAVPFAGCNFVMQTTSRNTAYPLSFDLTPGQYKIKFTNLDATNAITVQATLGTTA